MKNILLLAYHFPPAPTIGAQRPSKLAKYLPQFGWKPIILTVGLAGERPAGTRVIETEFRDVLGPARSVAAWFDGRHGTPEPQPAAAEPQKTAERGRAARLLRDLIAFPDDFRGWYKYALQAGEKLLRSEKVDALVSTSYPVTSHLIARRLKQEFSLPWIADLRDLWTQNHYLRKSRLVRFCEQKLELRTFADADLLVTVSEPWAEALRGLHRSTPVVSITNGFDDDDFSGVPAGRTPEFTITHTGILYCGRRDPSLLFEVVAGLIQEGKLDRTRTRIRFIGSDEAWLGQMAGRYKLEDVVTICSTVPRPEALRLQRESQLLFLLRWDHPSEAGMHTAKIFEYLGSRRPIIAVGGPGGVVKELLETTGSGRFAGSREDLRAIILDYYGEYCRTGEIAWQGNDRVEDYSHRSIARRYAAALERVASC